MRKPYSILSVFIFVWIGFACCGTSDSRFSILDFGAAGDGETMNTDAVM